jgi:hypothetical protein
MVGTSVSAQFQKAGAPEPFVRVRLIVSRRFDSDLTLPVRHAWMKKI